MTLRILVAIDHLLRVCPSVSGIKAREKRVMREQPNWNLIVKLKVMNIN